jgi:hypothetical protein
MRKQRPITGSIQPKDGKVYAVINEYVDGKRKPNWIDTGFKVHGGKRNAAEFLQRELVRRNDERNKPARLKDASADMLFVDYLRIWLKTKKNDLERITYQRYGGSIEGRINTYFSARGRKLSTLESGDFEDFYDALYEDGLSGTTAQYFHRIMKQAMNYAVKRDILLYNIMDKVDAPRRSKYVASYYTREETPAAV